MKFLVDAQLPRHLAASLKPGRSGHAVYARHQYAQNVGQRKDVG
jgi:predicted nuclease of predicted toxin-antitoxin system